MIQRIHDTFARLRAAKTKGLITYLTAGDPSMPRTIEDVLALVDAGVDLIELGVPFSDPLADGRVNAESAHRALKGGITMSKILSGIRTLRRRCDVPIVLYSYMNPVLAGGFEPTVNAMAASGVDGLLILDMPPEEGGEFIPALRTAGVAPILLVTPTSPPARMKKVAALADGFIYCVSRTGVTGVRKDISSDAFDVTSTMRRHTRKPLALGFGISTPAQAATAAAEADAVVVGSALVDRLHKAGDNETSRAAVFAWVRRMARAVHSAGGSGHASNHGA